jgi:hypothetical protein
LVNALRHSEATSIEAEIEYLPRRLRVVVRDNGRGINPEMVRSGQSGRCGIAKMRERAESIGAQTPDMEQAVGWHRGGTGHPDRFRGRGCLIFAPAQRHLRNFRLPARNVPRQRTP